MGCAIIVGREVICIRKTRLATMIELQVLLDSHANVSQRLNRADWAKNE